MLSELVFIHEELTGRNSCLNSCIKYAFLAIVGKVTLIAKLFDPAKIAIIGFGDPVTVNINF